MLAIKIEPLVGIHINTIGSLQLEASKKEVEDLLKSKHFWTIGIGVKDYYN